MCGRRVILSRSVPEWSETMERRSRTRSGWCGLWRGGEDSGGEVDVFSSWLVEPSSHEVNVSGGLACSAGILTRGSVREGVSES